MIDTIVNYFADMPSLHRALILIGGLTFFFLLENAAPLFALTYKRGQHTLTNLFFTLTTVIVNFAMAAVLFFAADWVAANNFGIVNWLPDNLVLQVIVGLLVMDFLSSWLAHYVEHHVKWMWKFHVIHHTDQHVDTTTANRHHPGESVIRFVFTTAAVFVAGAPIWLIFFYQSMSVVLTQFNHSNIKMPEWLDNALVWVFCTPNMHRVHHHYRQPYSDTNYGNIFSFWDRIFGTYVKVDNTKLVYGVDTHMEHKETTSILEMLKLPFLPYRPHIEYKDEEKL